jgi:hypothetical protein
VDVWGYTYARPRTPRPFFRYPLLSTVNDVKNHHPAPSPPRDVNALLRSAAGIGTEKAQKARKALQLQGFCLIAY